MNPGHEKTQREVGVAVIGAGIAGLATARHLAQEGIEAVVFDRRPTGGGRFSTLEIEGERLNQGALMYTPALYPNFHSLVANLGIEWIPIPLSDLLLRVGSTETAMHTWGLFRSGLFSFREFRTWQRLKRLIRGLTFDPENPHPELERLHSMDFVTFLREQAGFSDKLLDYFAQPFCSWAYADPEMLAADYGLYFFAFPVFQGMRTPRLGMQAVTDTLISTLPEEPRFGHKLEGVDVEMDGRLRLRFRVGRRGNCGEDGGAEEREVRARCVVFANGQQSALGRWLPGLDLRVQATKTRGVVIEFRSEALRRYRLLLYGKHENRHGVHGGELVHLPDGRTLGGVFLYRPDADLEAVFPGYRKLGQVAWSPAISISTPGCTFPDVTTPFPSVFVVGDFFRYCTIESCAFTARRAATEIAARAKRKDLDLSLCSTR